MFQSAKLRKFLLIPTSSPLKNKITNYPNKSECVPVPVKRIDFSLLSAIFNLFALSLHPNFFNEVRRGVAQLAARYVRDVEVGSSSLLTPTISKKSGNYMRICELPFLFLMADNYIENQYEEYLKQKAAKEAAKRAAWRKRLQAYKEKLAKEKENK